MFLSLRFLTHIRQYAALEEAMNRDYTVQVDKFARDEAQRLIDEGNTEEASFALVNQALKATVKRFPTEISPIPF